MEHVFIYVPPAHIYYHLIRIYGWTWVGQKMKVAQSRLKHKSCGHLMKFFNPYFGRHVCSYTFPCDGPQVANANTLDMMSRIRISGNLKHISVQKKNWRPDFGEVWGSGGGGGGC